MERWRGWLWIGFMITLLLLMSGVLTDFLRQEPDRIPPESTSASNTTSETYDFDALPHLVIAGSVGNVMIRANRDSSAITIHHTKTAYGTSEEDATEKLDDVIITTAHEGNTLTINTVQRQSNNSQRSNRVDLVITVPDEIALDVDVATGNVQIVGVRAAAVFKVRVETGDVTLENVTAPEGMDIQANAGSLTFAGTIGSEGEYALTASIGSLVARLPAATHARLDGQTTLGSITVEGFDPVGLSEQHQGSGETLRGMIGDGGPLLTIKNQMGNIRIEAQ